MKTPGERCALKKIWRTQSARQIFFKVPILQRILRIVVSHEPAKSKAKWDTKAHD